MLTLDVMSADAGLIQGIYTLNNYGVPRTSRNGDTLEVPEPVATTFLKPTQRVLFNPVRNNNPFFSLFEALWILAGRNDVAFLAQFVKRMADFSDNGVTFHAPYGYRLRHTQGMDQIEQAMKLLAKSPDTRRAVLQIWDARQDLNVDSLDVDCNNLIYLKIRDNRLYMTVCNRSNDIILGLYNVNIVQFSMLQEYIAAGLSVQVGPYTHVSDSFHAYITGKDGELWNKLNNAVTTQPQAFVSKYAVGDCKPTPIINRFTQWNVDLHAFFHEDADQHVYQEPFFAEFAVPVYLLFLEYKKVAKQDKLGAALIVMEQLDKLLAKGQYRDWIMAMYEWMDRKRRAAEVA